MPEAHPKQLKMWVLLWKATVKRRKKYFFFFFDQQRGFPFICRMRFANSLEAESRSCFKATFGFMGFGGAVQLWVKPYWWASTRSAVRWVNPAGTAGWHHRHWWHKLWMPSCSSFHLLHCIKPEGTDSPHSSSRISWPSPAHCLPVLCWLPAHPPTAPACPPRALLG